MSKAVLISIQPKWCELIANGKKTIEVRKTKPKLETPFKVYIYCTKGKGLLGWHSEYKDNRRDNEHEFKVFSLLGKSDFFNGKVIGEFVCDRTDNYIYKETDGEQYWRFPDTREIEKVKKESCLTIGQIIDYTGDSDNCYAWHISDLKIYDKPKELSEFLIDCKNCGKKFVGDPNCWQGCVNGYRRLTRPPQSWCYVEEMQNA